MISHVALVDSDGVLANFAQGLLDIHIERVGLPVMRNGLPMTSTDQWINYRIEDQFIEETATRMNALMHEPGFFAALRPYPLSKQLSDMIRGAGHQVDICTMPISRRFGTIDVVDPIAIADKLGWFVRHFPHDAKSVVLTKRKSHIYGSVLIEDCLDNVHAWCDYHPHGLGILIDRPWNRVLKLDRTNAIRVKSYTEAATAAIRHMNAQQRHPA